MMQKTLEMLASFQTQDWLRQRLARMQAPPPRPHVVVVDSSPGDMQETYGHPLQQQAAWRVITPADDELAATLDDADVIVWGMSALRLFPGESAAILERARADAIPILAVVVGTQRVGNPDAFHQILAQWLTTLPTGSQFFTGSEAYAALNQTLSQNARTWVERRAPIRFQHLRDATRHEIILERVEVQGEAQAAENALALAQTGVASLRVRCGGATEETLQLLHACTQNIASFLQSELPPVMSQAANLEAPAFIDKLAAPVQQWSGQFEAVRRKSVGASQASITRWCDILADDCRASFSKFSALARDPATTSALAKISFDGEQAQLNAALTTLAQDIAAAAQQFNGEWTRFLSEANKQHTQTSAPRPEPTPARKIIIDKDDSWDNYDPSTPPASPSPTQAKLPVPNGDALMSQVSGLVARAQLTFAQQEMINNVTNIFARLYNRIFVAINDCHAPWTDILQSGLQAQATPLLQQCSALEQRAQQRVNQLQQALIILQEERP